MTTVLCSISLIRPADAAELLALKRRVDLQSPFLLVSPAEREPDPAQLTLALQAHGPRGTFGLLARVGTAAAGWITVEVSPLERAAFTGLLTLAVDATHQRQGVGSALLAAAEAEARRRGLRRLELGVMRGNGAARRLYERAGYDHEGVRRSCLLVDGVMVDEFHMGRLLTSPPSQVGPGPASAETPSAKHQDPRT